MGSASERYQPPRADADVLHTVVREHLDHFLRAAADRADGAGLPEFIAREFRGFLTFGVLAHGFARVHCERCAPERLVPFSCKGRGFCPSCGGHRMTERAAHLVDEIVPPVPVRQWVLTLPSRLRSPWRGITVSAARCSRSMPWRCATSIASRPRDRASERAAPGP
jgi:hypothetical protein